MRIVLQRVSYGSVKIEDRIVGEIHGPGLVLLIGIGKSESEQELAFWAQKTVNLRVFPDDEGKMNRSLCDVQGSILAISQFTLFGDCRKGRRPGFSSAGAPELAKAQYLQFIEALKQTGVPVETGVFGADMQVTIHNDGPVTLLLGSDLQDA